MIADFERIVSKDEIAREGVERAVDSAQERVDAGCACLANEREAHLRLLAEKVDEAVARILADAERNVANRRARRELWMNEHTMRGHRLVDGTAGTFVGIFRGGPRKKTL